MQPTFVHGRSGYAPKESKKQRRSSRSGPVGAAIRSVIEGLEQRTLFSIFTVLNTNDTGSGSLNQAIVDANNHANSLNPGSAIDEIDFQIPGTGMHTIAPSTVLPDISDPVFINGYSQSGASANTLATGDNAVIQIELRGTNEQAGDNALTIDASNSVVRGLAIGAFPALANDSNPDTAGGQGILVNPGANITIAGNFIGLNAAGDTAFGNGIGIFDTGNASIIGGLTPADRNIISGNKNAGILVGSSGNNIQGNYFGTNSAGTAAIANDNNSIVVTGAAATSNTVGGNTAAARNIIVSNGTGVSLFDGSHDNKVQGNYIGINATASATLGTAEGVGIVQSTNNTIGGAGAGEGNVIGGGSNSGVSLTRVVADIVGPDDTGNVVYGNFIGISPTNVALPNLQGVSIEGATNNTIGGTGAGQANVIADNTLSGVVVRAGNNAEGTALTPGTGDKIVGNSIYANGALGIDLLTGPNQDQVGVTPDDPGDTDTGSNNLQNKPNITSASFSGGQTTISGNFLGGGAAAGNLTMDVYVSDTFDPSGFGEGQTFIGEATVANGSGTVNFGPLGFTGGALGKFVTATFTDSNGNTSEFSNALYVGDPFLVTNTNDTGLGSLRQAIINANTLPNYPGTDLIHFAIPGAGVHTITPATPLPFITHQVTIDGYSQAGSSANTLASGDNAVIDIELNGANAGALASGLVLVGAASSGSTIKGLAINRFTSEGINIQTASTGNTITGNFLGTDPTGTIGEGNGIKGVFILSSNNTIGGTNSADRNVIAFNVDAGIQVNTGPSQPDSVGNRIVGNSIHDNGRLGIDLVGGTENSFGVTADDAGDTDTGPNNLQNKPHLTGASLSNGHTLLSGDFLGSGSGTYTLDVYASPAADPSGFGEGATFVGETTIANGSGTVSFTDVQLPAATVGQFITATLTDANGNTSEFSNVSQLGAGSTNPLIVTNTNDSGNGSLRAAITFANSHANGASADVISFAIPGSGVQTINPLTALPDITDPVTIDAYTQSGSSANTLATGSNATLLIDLSGSLAPAGTDLLSINADNSLIRGFIVNGYTNDGLGGGNGVHILSGHTGNKIAGNFIGTNSDASAFTLGENFGVLVDNAPSNTIGGTTPQERNVISGNTIGVEITGTGATGNVVEGNYIGTNAAGSAALVFVISTFSIPQGTGIEINTAGNTVGGTTAGARNVVSGNSTGILLNSATATGDTVEGNYIGTNAAGTAAIANSIGIDLYGPDNTIGGTTAGTRNIISSNGTGIAIYGVTLSENSSGNTIEGNYIGSDVTGAVALSNGTGISINNSPNNLIGGTTVAARNVIDGIFIADGKSGGIDVYGDANTIQGNYIGTNAAGTAALGTAGIELLRAGPTLIGGTVAGAGNVISGKANVNINTYGGYGHVIEDNIIGLDATGTKVIGGFVGIDLNECSNSFVGGNVISGNGFEGLEITQPDATNNKVQGNFIGTDITGTKALGNGFDTANNESAIIFGGIAILGANGNLIGGPNPGDGNIIADNNGIGIGINQAGIYSAAQSSNNAIEGNSIFSNTGLGIDLNFDGVTSTRDAGDTDTGPNELQNIPVIASAISDGTQTKIDVQLKNAASQTYRVEFFSNAAADPSGFGEGQAFLGTAQITTDSGGNVDKTVTLPVALANGTFVTATVTNSDGTSEFSADVAVTAPVGPSVTINQANGQADPTSTSPVLFTVTFSAPVTGFGSDDLILSGTAGATTSVVTGGPSVYTVSVSGMTTSGTVIASIKAGAAKDSNNTPSAASTSTDNTIVYSQPVAVAPTVTINQAAGQGDPTSTSPVLFTVTFSAPVTGFGSDDVVLTGTAGATTAVIAGGPSVYTVSVSGMTQTGTVIASIKAGAAQDSNNTPSAASTSTDNTVVYNEPVAVAPTVTINQASGQADPTSTSPVLFTVTFSAPVTGFDSGDVVLSGTAGATTSVVTGGPSVYTVSVSGMTQSGTVVASIKAGAAQDSNNTPSAASTSTDNTVVYNEPVAVAPTVTINQASGQGDPTSTSPVLFTVTFSAPVTGFGSDDVVLSGTAGATAAVVTGGPSVYTVSVSGMTQSGTVIATVSAGAAQDSNNTPSAASTSTDNTVIYNQPVVVAPTVAINDVSHNEGNTGTTSFVFTVTRSGDPTVPFTVDFATGDGSATVADNDYVAQTGTLTFNAGDTTQTITVLVNGDTKVEPDEIFTVTLSNFQRTSQTAQPASVQPAGAVNPITRAIGTGTIKNDDAAAPPTKPTLKINDVTMNEGNSGTTNFTFTVTRSGDTSGKTTVKYATADGSAKSSSDYSSKSGTITFNAGDTSKTITISVHGDTTIESDETFNVLLSSASNATIADGTGVGTIKNDDARKLPTLAINDVSKAEGDADQTPFTFTITRSGDLSGKSTVNFTTMMGTAPTGTNGYFPRNGTITFAPGEKTKTITVEIDAGTLIEPDETFKVVLSNPSGATISDGTGVGTILNDDTAITIGDVKIKEGKSGKQAVQVTIKLVEHTTKTVTVNYKTADGTAKAGSDYVAASGTLTFKPGETSKTITLFIDGDTQKENDETFFINLTNAVNASIADKQGIVTILNDD